MTKERVVVVKQEAVSAAAGYMKASHQHLVQLFLFMSRLENFVYALMMKQKFEGRINVFICVFITLRNFTVLRNDEEVLCE